MKILVKNLGQHIAVVFSTSNFTRHSCLDMNLNRGLLQKKGELKLAYVHVDAESPPEPNRRIVDCRKVMMAGRT